MGPSTPTASAGRVQPVADLDMNKISTSKACLLDSNLTPPITPVKDHEEHTTLNDSTGENQTTESPENSIITFDGTLELEAEIGRGAWSKVYAAHEKPVKPEFNLAQHPLTPPASPASALSAMKCYAVKVPSHSLASAIIKQEAIILSRLAQAAQSAPHIVRFHGLDPATNSLVLSRASETLQTLASTALHAERSTANARPSTEPVIGLKPWLDISLQLARGLAWLHRAGVVHGDIKASNILLFPSTALTCTLSEELPTPKAVYCDFSSARLLASDAAQVALPTDALTTSYAAPELLRHCSSAVATEASDVWALAVTLVVAATGEDPYAHVGHEMQKLGMAKEGMVLEGAETGGWRAATRVRRGGVVERAVRRALTKKVENRTGVEAWIEVLEGLEREADLK